MNSTSAKILQCTITSSMENSTYIIDHRSYVTDRKPPAQAAIPVYCHSQQKIRSCSRMNTSSLTAATQSLFPCYSAAPDSIAPGVTKYGGMTNRHAHLAFLLSFCLYSQQSGCASLQNTIEPGQKLLKLNDILQQRFRLWCTLAGGAVSHQIPVSITLPHSSVK